MAKAMSEDIGAFYQHYPRVATIVTAHASGKDNAMAVAWHMPISFSPPLYGVAIASKRFTYRLIVDSQEFGVNFIPFESAEMIAAVGGSKGEQVDKFRQFDIAKDKPTKTAVPVLKAAYAAYECKLVEDRDYGDHRLLVGEIVAVHQPKGFFTTDGTLDLDRVSPAMYIGNEIYVTTARDTVQRLDREVYGKA